MLRCFCNRKSVTLMYKLMMTKNELIFFIIMLHTDQSYPGQLKRSGTDNFLKKD